MSCYCDEAERNVKYFTRSKEALIWYKQSCKTSLERSCIVLSRLFQKDGFKLGTCSAMAARMHAGMENPSDKNGLKRAAFFLSLAE